MAIPKNAIERLRFFAGLLCALEAVVETPYLKFVKGRKLGPAPTREIDYRSVATKKQAASLLGFRKIEGQVLRTVGFDEYKLTPGIIAQSETITAADAGLMSAKDDVIYVNSKQIDAEESVYRDKAYSIKTAVELRKNIMVAQLVHDGKYTSVDGRVMEFPIRPVDTLDYTEHGKFLVNYKKQLRAYIKANGKRPQGVIVGEKIVDELLRDKVFMDEVYKLGLAGFDQDNKEVVIARVLGTQLEEEAPAYDPDLDIDSAKGNRITFINTDRLHDAYGGLEALVGTTPKIVASEYIGYEDIDTKNQSVEFIGKSAYSPVLSDANGIWRIEVDLPTGTPQGQMLYTVENNLPKTEEELKALIEEKIKEAFVKINSAAPNATADIDSMKVEELRAYAEEKGIELTSSMNKSEIIEKIKSSMQ